MARSSQQESARSKSRAKKKKAKRKQWMLKKRTTTVNGASAHDTSGSDSFESAESGDSGDQHSEADEGEFEEARATTESCIICYRDDLNDDIIRPCRCIGENMGHHFSCLIKRIVKNEDRSCHCGLKFEDPRIRRIGAPDLSETVRRYWQFYVVCGLALGVTVKNLLESQTIPPPIIFIMAYCFIHFVLYVPSIFGLEGESIEFTCRRQDGTEFLYKYEFGPKEGNMELNDVIAAITGETPTD